MLDCLFAVSASSAAFSAQGASEIDCMQEETAQELALPKKVGSGVDLAGQLGRSDSHMLNI
jgi:hypothetical protein